MTHFRSVYSGFAPKLVIAIDVGTTYSGASYAILIPDEVPRIYDVADLRLASMMVGNPPLVDLPPGRTVTDVFGEFLKYMYDCVQAHIINTQVDGQELWSSLNGTAHFVLSHTNGWRFYQQGEMRKAAIRGGLVPATPEGHERVEFVTEGEASFHWCVDKGSASAALEVGANIVVADLGGGTIDVSSFLVQTPGPLRLSELKAPECEYIRNAPAVTHAANRNPCAGLRRFNDIAMLRE
ncbi:hypothetical protein FS837_008866, partial [Tulasnella sp. UAMH 9824]